MASVSRPVEIFNSADNVVKKTEPESKPKKEKLPPKKPSKKPQTKKIKKTNQKKLLPWM